MDISASATSGGGLYSTEVEPADAWAGVYVITYAPTPGYVRVGQRSTDGTDLDVWQSFLEFDLTGVESVGTAQLSVWFSAVNSPAPTLLVAPYDYGGGAVTAADWRDRTELQALTVGASLVPGIQGTYSTFVDAGLAALLVPGAVNRLVVFAQGHRDGVVPATASNPWADMARSDPAHPARLTIAATAPPVVDGPIPVYVTVDQLRLATGAAPGPLQDERLALCCILGSRYVDGTVGVAVADESDYMPPYEIALVPCPPAYRLGAMTAAVRFTKSQDLPFGAVGGLGDLAVYVRGQTIPEVDLILTGHRMSFGVA